MTLDVHLLTVALDKTREQCAAVAEKLIAEGRTFEVAEMIRRGIAVDRLPPPASAAPAQPKQKPGKAGASGAGFDLEISQARFAQQMGRTPP